MPYTSRDKRRGVHICMYLYMYSTVRVIKKVTLNGNRNAHNS